MPKEEFWFRYEDVQYASSVDEFGSSSGSGQLVVELRKYRVVRHTPKVWLALHGSSWLRFTLLEARKRFACPTLEQAKDSFIARKKRQASIYQARLYRANQAIVEMERISARSLRQNEPNKKAART